MSRSRRRALRRGRSSAGESVSAVTLIALGILTTVAFGLRVVGIDQSLFGDEYFTHAIVTKYGLTGIWDEVYSTSITPPLHYYLAWASLKLGGDSVVMVRLPSLVAGTAIVPLMFMIGRRVGGELAGLLAAALMALSPFAIFYSTEGRTYAVLMFLVAVSMWALLRAVHGDGRGWWVLFAVSSCAALWAHYTSLFVILTGAAWAAWVHRDSLRSVAVAVVAIGVGYLPWLPGFIEQRQNDEGLAIISAFSSVSLGSVFELPLRMLFGHPFLGLDTLPGRPGLLFVVVFAAVAVAIAVTRFAAVREAGPFLSSEAGLMLLLALATPVGLLLYDLAGPTLYGTRNLSASLPALAVLAALLLGSLTTTLSLRFAAPALVAVVAVLAIGAVDTVGDENRRPPTREVARYLDRAAGADLVVESPLDAALDDRLGRSALQLYFERPHHLSSFGVDDAAVWQEVKRGRTAYYVRPLPEADAGDDPVERQLRLGGPDGLSLLRDMKTFPGLIPLVALRYQGALQGSLTAGGGQETISWSYGDRVVVSPGVARGAVDSATPPDQPSQIGGWALAGTPSEPPDWVLCFARGRLVAASAGGEARNVTGAAGRASLPAGFTLSPPRARPDGARLRVFAVVGDRASELPLTATVRDALR